VIAPRISDHALLRWMERAHGVDVDAWRELMRQEVQASLDAAGLERVETGPAFVIAATGAAVVTYLPEGFDLSPFGMGVGIPRRANDAEQSEAA